MFKKTLVFMVFTVSFVLTACTSVSPISSSDSTVQDAYNVSSEELNLEVVKMHNKPLLDWDDEVFRAMRGNPRFGGYFTDSGMLTLQMKSKHGKEEDLNALSEDERNRNEHDTERAKKDLIKLLSTSPSAPVLTTEQGQVIPYANIGINVQMVKVSYNRLYLWRKLLRSAFQLNLINGLGIDQPTNKISVGVNSEQDRVDLLEYMNKVHIASDAVTIQVQKIILTTGLNSKYRPVFGGLRITLRPTPSGSIESCTLGLPVLLGTVEGYLTASHCTGLDLGVNRGFIAYQADEQIGLENNDPPNLPQSSCPTTDLCRNADVVFIKNTVVGFSRSRIIMSTQTIGSTDTLTNVDGSNKFYDITSTANRPALSTILTNLAPYSGWKQAKVVNTNWDLPLPVIPKVVILGTVKVFSTSVNPSGCEGDSGSPWYQPTSATQASFYGIQSAVAADSRGWFEALLNRGVVFCFHRNTGIFISKISRSAQLF